MGVPGLSSYVRDELRPTRHEYAHGEVVLVDGLNWIYSCDDVQDASAVLDEVDAFLETCAGGDVHPLFIFDGAPPLDKMRVISERSEKKFAEVEALCKRIPAGVKVWTEALRKARISVRCLTVAVQNRLRERGCPFFCCIDDADRYIASLAAAFSLTIISNDSDFLLCACPAVIPHYELKVFEGTVIGQGYSSSSLATHLKIDQSRLPLLGVMLGNDYAPRKASRTSLSARVRGCVDRIHHLLAQPLSGVEQKALSTYDPFVVPPQMADGQPATVHLLLSVLDQWSVIPAELVGVPPEALSFYVAIQRKSIRLSDMAEDVMEESCWAPSQSVRQRAYAAAMSWLREPSPSQVSEYYRGNRVMTVDVIADDFVLYSASESQRWEFAWRSIANGARSVDGRQERAIEMLRAAAQATGNACACTTAEHAALRVLIGEKALARSANDKATVKRRGVHLLACVRSFLASIELLLYSLHLPCDSLSDAVLRLNERLFFTALHGP